MPSYNLTNLEVDLLVTWLFEPHGYLDFAIRLSDNQTAREALIIDPNLDVTQWVRDNSQVKPSASNEASMAWWIRTHDQINIPPPQRPPETISWTSILYVWDNSIVTAFGNVGQAQRDTANAVTMYDQQGIVIGEMRAGTHLLRQRQIINKTLSVLE